MAGSVEFCGHSEFADRCWLGVGGSYWFPLLRRRPCHTSDHSESGRALRTTRRESSLEEGVPLIDRPIDPSLRQCEVSCIFQGENSSGSRRQLRFRRAASKATLFESLSFMEGAEACTGFSRANEEVVQHDFDPRALVDEIFLSRGSRENVTSRGLEGSAEAWCHPKAEIRRASPEMN